MKNEDLFKKYAQQYRLMVNQGSTPAEALAKCLEEVDTEAKKEVEKLNNEKINEQNLKTLEEAINSKFCNVKGEAEEKEEAENEKLNEDFQKFLKAFGFRPFELPKDFHFRWLLY